MDNPVGPGSYGQSDEDGRFVRHTIDDDSRGAVVGTHRVSIYASKKVAKTECSTEEASGSAERDLTQYGERRKRRKLTPGFHNGSLTFDVSQTGIDAANFEVEIE